MLRPKQNSTINTFDDFDELKRQFDPENAEEQRGLLSKESEMSLWHERLKEKKED
jgi:hypothetical protein